jgi:signal transduction histidine kinase
MAELRPALLAIAVFAAVLGAVDLGLALQVTRNEPVAVHVLVPVVGMSFVATGLVAWWRRPGNRTGQLMVGTGLLWLVAGLEQADAPLAFTIGLIAIYPTFAMLSHTLIAFPTGRLRGRRERGVVIALYVIAILGTAPTLLNDQVRWRTFLSNVLLSCDPCPRNLFDTFDLSFLSTGGTALRLVAFAVALGAAAASLILRWRRAPEAQRREYAPVALIGVAGLALLLVASLLAGVNVDYGPQQLLGLAALALLALLPLAMGNVIVRGGFGRTAVDPLLARVGDEGVGGDELTGLVRRALGDPTAEVVAGGAAPAADGRTVTPLIHDGERVGAIVHEGWLDEEGDTVRRVSGVVALTLAMRASRERIVLAGDRERRRIARDLHDGAQQQLVALALQARMLDDGAGGDLDRLGDAIDTTAAELRGLVHGILPPALERHGLSAALREAADRSAVPVSVDDATGSERADPDVEQAAYFVAAEALTNAAKHANATRIEMRVARAGDRLVVEIVDDGSGGATLGTGVGLRGMADRAAALAGRLDITSPEGGGTRVRLELPWQVSR